MSKLPKIYQFLIGSSILAVAYFFTTNHYWWMILAPIVVGYNQLLNIQIKKRHGLQKSIFIFLAAAPTFALLVGPGASDYLNDTGLGFKAAIVGGALFGLFGAIINHFSPKRIEYLNEKISNRFSNLESTLIAIILFAILLAIITYLKRPEVMTISQ